ncbi:MAG: acyl carrier protein [Rickettsia endosymbiont of Ixodes persulcatus]|uniref:acyl carrier protein n=1 Tax=Candidatus Rickettsia colombianensi TaxID=1090944 RepID=UPI0015ACD0C5|nr:acyl carrier protein [Candidatus Rickettsia colombianensi]MCZ6901523.1 acyl carrier protein [Rickettsia endosymbiont of Ixodes persulcatus]MCZ6902847.1 acyl carrier protein [Rickettsia endosymbiont of Ixodes persulcatus]MCZ6908697.1 acyl carrier protein [Rickettsia endosymbiont of Ixodes persulcatus]MCZ6909802.1 acyl carrier protein [Rickettsia endosymbiont of Ixodes persulcatus]MCZ6913338.1 acyl carrier protein [Rickettsia endosymbiont of Ixodes persulcatus]
MEFKIMSTTDKIEQKVIEMVAEKLNKDKSIITTDSRFIEDLKADSLDTVELMMAIEVEYGIDIPDDEATKIKTVSDVIKYIKERQA